MANHQIPRRATRIERIHGLDPAGDVITCTVYEHTRPGHAHPMFYVVQYRWNGYKIDRATRTTNQVSGPGARLRLEGELAQSRKLFEATRIAAARRGC